METSFGHWVRRRRKALDLTQDELARRVGCSLSAIFKIEADERRPSRQVAALLAEQLEIPEAQRGLFLKVARQERTPASLDTIEPPADPGPAAAPPSRPGSLPVFPTPFVGREYEIDIVARQLRDPACRLLTLTGPGGVGKTRLAVEVARRIQDAFPDGVAFISMIPVSQPESILPAIAEGLGVVFSGPAEPRQQVLSALRGRSILLVLDNMEHLVPGCAILGEILEQAPNVRLLLTSREPVRLRWEWLFDVQGLPIPEASSAEALENNSAAILFLQRARQVRRDFVLTPAEAAALVRICRLVDGLPLGIELAAAWVQSLSFEEVAGELERSADVLETSMQDVPARHRSMRVVFDHSWALLPAAEQAALRRLSVFAGGFTRPAAEAVAGAALPLLSTLVSKSLLRYSSKTGRYDLHELVRQYACEQLRANPEEEEQIFAAQSSYYAAWLAGLETSLKSGRQVETSQQIRAETANWMAAWRWAAGRRRLDLLRKSLGCLSWFFEIHGYYADALTLTRFAVSRLREAGAPGSLGAPAERAAFASLVDQDGWFLFRTGDLEGATARFEESLALAAEAQDAEALFYIHNNWAYLAMLSGNTGAARRLALESLGDARQLGGQWHFAIAESVVGVVEYQEGHLREAYFQLASSLAAWRAVGDPRGLTFCMLYLSSVALALGEVERAETILHESNAIALENRDRWAQAFGLSLLGQAAMTRGAPDQARDLYERSLALSREIADRLAATQTLIHLGDALAALGEEGEAQRLFREAGAGALQAHWAPNLLAALTAFVAIDHAVEPETGLAVALSVLAHPALVPEVRRRVEGLRDRLAPALDERQVAAAQARAAEKSAEQWAREILQEHTARAVYSAYR